jgi:hypothetical protein
MAGVVIKGTDAIGTTGIDVTSECTITSKPSSGEFNSAGEKTITVTHTPSGKTATFTVTVAKILTGNITITGTAKVSYTLTANTASLNGTTGALEYAWYRKNAAGEAISPSNQIEGASAGTYALTSADEDKFITLVVTRTGYTGSSQAPTTAVVVGYSVGDTGPGGGTIYHKQATYSGGWRYLEVSPNDLNGSSRSYGLTTGTDLPAYNGSGGKTDWRLPTLAEILLLREAYVEHTIGLSFVLDRYYWTSEVYPSGTTNHQIVVINGDYHVNQGSNTDKYHARAVRQF